MRFGMVISPPSHFGGYGGSPVLLTLWVPVGCLSLGCFNCVIPSHDAISSCQGLAGWASRVLTYEFSLFIFIIRRTAVYRRDWAGPMRCEHLPSYCLMGGVRPGLGEGRGLHTTSALIGSVQIQRWFSGGGVRWQPALRWF